jgi:hypothetical protein
MACARHAHVSLLDGVMMEKSSQTESDFLKRLVHTYYRVVPLKYRTFCALNTAVCVRVLQHFGFQARPQTCQVWYADPKRQNFLVGFVGKHDAHKWDGHVVCTTDTHVLDASLHHFKNDFQLEAPDIALSLRIQVPSQVFSRLYLNNGSTLSWLYPPHGVDASIPQEPDALISELSGQLVAMLNDPVHEQKMNQPS